MAGGKSEEASPPAAKTGMVGGNIMSSFVFCMIFIQVSIFFIAGFLGLTSLYCVLRDRRQGVTVPTRSVSRNRFHRRTGILLSGRP